MERQCAVGALTRHWAQREGVYPPPKGVTDLPGLEVSGVVVGTGASVTHIQEGDRVCALLAGAGYAEYAVADAATVLPHPLVLSAAEAAAVPEAAFTVWHNMFHRFKLKQDMTVLVHGGSSGIGARACARVAAPVPTLPPLGRHHCDSDGRGFARAGDCDCWIRREGGRVPRLGRRGSCELQERRVRGWAPPRQAAHGVR